MTVTIHRPVYTGTGWRAMNGSGLALTLEQEVESLEQAIYDVVTDIRAVLGGPGSTITQQLAQATATGDTTLQYARAGLVITIASAAGMATGGFPGALAAAIDTALTLAAVDVAAGQLAEPAGYQVAQIGSGATPVTPVTPPPAGYGGDSASDIADAVWGYLLSIVNAQNQNHNIMAGNLLGLLGSWGNIYAGSDGQGDIRTPYFRWVSRDAAFICSPNWPADLAPWNTIPRLDFSLVQPGDTVLSYLTREYGAWDWTTDDPQGRANSGRVWALVLNEEPYVWLRCTLTDEQLHHLTTPTTTAAGGAPVWPGEDGVTFGTGVPLAAGVVVEEVMDGIELNILSSDRQIPYVGAGTFKLYRSMGRVAFMSDDGYLEAWQPVPANQCVMVPKSMAQASGVVLSFYTGVAGLVTPWTRNV